MNEKLDIKKVSLQKLMDVLPCGAFAKIVREQVDPLYGTADQEEHLWDIKIRYWFTGSATHKMEIQATTADAARKLAKDAFRDEILDFDCSDASVSDFEINDITKRGSDADK